MATLLDGKQLAADLMHQLRARVQALSARGIRPGLTVIRVGDDPASKIYVAAKRRACDDIGIHGTECHLPATTTAAQLVEQIARCNHDPNVHAILVQLPLPATIDTSRILASVDPDKDVDGFHPMNMGRLMLGLPGPRPCTPLGIMALLAAATTPIAGARAVVIGRSAIVGRPTALLLTAADATVTLCHSKTADLSAAVREASIVVVACGRPHAIPGEWIRPGATVIDVGINRLPNGTIVGDVDFAAAERRAAAITPVPGGVGPMTIAMLCRNTIDCAERTP